jgi:hypothetical protein
MYVCTIMTITSIKLAAVYIYMSNVSAYALAQMVYHYEYCLCPVYYTYVVTYKPHYAVHRRTYRGAMTMSSKLMQRDVPLVMIPYKTAACVRMYADAVFVREMLTAERGKSSIVKSQSYEGNAGSVVKWVLLSWLGSCLGEREVARLQGE